MSSLPSGAEAGWIGPRDRISMMTQLRGGVGRLRAAAGPLAVLALATLALSIGAQLAATALGVQLTGLELSPGYGVYVVVATLVSSVLTAMAMRTLVRGREGWLRIDAPLVIGAGVLSAATLVFVGGNVAYMHVLRRFADPNGIALAALVMMAAYVASAYVALKLALWPLGLMMDNPRVTPARSWRLMAKATRGLVLSYVLLGLPLILLAFSASRLLVADAVAVTLSVVKITASAVGIIFTYCGSAMVATIYDLRVTRAGDVAEVFD